MSCETCDEIKEFCVEQGGTLEYSATLLKPDTTPVPLAELVSLTLRLTNQDDGAIINSRDSVSILNANGGTFHATSGALTLQLAAADNPITSAGASARKETHVAMITATWSNGSKRWPILVHVDNLDLVAGSAPA